MKVLQINTIVGTGSTGRIAEDILKMILAHGDEGGIAAAIDNSSEVVADKVYQIGRKSTSRAKHALAARLTDRSGFFSKKETHELVEYIKKEKFDIIHLHNLHGYYINLPILFNELSRLNLKVIWTFHDCWPMTGHCSYFDYIGCQKWKEQCMNCPQKKRYPKSFFMDRSYENYLEKKELFHNLDFTIVTPSKWLGEICRQSFLADKEVMVIPNGVDLEAFYPRDTSLLREKLGLKDKFIVIAVSAGWNMKDSDDRKGLADILKLSERLDDSYQIVMLGFLNDKAMEGLPQKIIGVKRTRSLDELAKWYSLGDVFINPTQEEVLGMVNIEALACGTPVITYDSGGSPETIDDDSGMIISRGNIKMLAEAIKKCKAENFSKTSCVKRARHFEKSVCYEQYYDLYQHVLGNA